jgi:OOP family OmpA-OmpF porin
VNVLFDNDRYEIRPEYFPLLDQLAADITARYSHLKIEVQGHTSNTASAAHNMRLSINRANAVTNYLDKRIKVPHSLTPRGYGLTRPLFTNETYEGRAKNRRVQMEILR